MWARKLWKGGGRQENKIQIKVKTDDGAKAGKLIGELWREKLQAEFHSECVKTKMTTVRKTLTSLQTSMVPKMTCRPSKKLSPMMMTVAPPVVQPSLGLMALMHGGDPWWGTQGEKL